MLLIYRRKPEAVKAVQWDGKNIDEIKAILDPYSTLDTENLVWTVPSCDGLDFLYKGSYVIVHGKNDYDFVSKETFENDYELYE